MQLQKFYNDLQQSSPLSKRPLSAKSVKNTHMISQAALNKALKLGLIKKNPEQDVQLPRPKKYKAEVYNKVEIAELLEKSKDTDQELEILMLLVLGTRRGETVGFKWSDINWDRCQITVNRSLAMKNKKLIEKSPKTESSQRTIDMPEELVEMLKTAKVNYENRRMKYGDKFHDGDYILCHDNGEPYHPDAFSGRFDRFIKRIGMKKIRLHDMRHTSATMMLSLGISPKVTQKRLGHSTFAIIMDTYCHVLEEMEKDAVLKISSVMFHKKDDEKDE